jgi:hypothetical protein
MQLFKYDAPVGASALATTNGQPINGAASVRWIERYADVGEFEIKAKLSTGLKAYLPAGTLISHENTYEMMIVENHEINETADEDPDLTITGRSFVSYLEQRIVGFDPARSSDFVGEYVIAAGALGAVIRDLIRKHVTDLAGANDVVPGLLADSTAVSGVSVPEQTIAKGPLLPEVIRMLALDDFGIRTIRPNPFGVVGSPSWTILRIYKGTDLSKQLIYSSRTGHMDSIDYLFSNKNFKTAALVIGRYVQATWTGGVGYGMRQVIIDGQDLDGHLNAAPSGTDLVGVTNRMRQRALTYLANQNEINIARADIAKTDPYRYRKDYNLGDLVTVAANYGEQAVMRIVEYVEIEDEGGESGHPTFALPLSP